MLNLSLPKLHAFFLAESHANAMPCSASPSSSSTDDSVVNVRAASRAEPEGGLRSGGQLALSLTEGFKIDK